MCIVYLIELCEREDIKFMKILTEAIVSNSDMFKDYKMCRETAEKYGKTFILKNNQPDAVLFSIGEYKKISTLMEYLDCLDEKDTEKLMDSIPRIITKEVEAYTNLVLK